MTISDLNTIDQEWLLAINSWHSDWADTLMWTISRSTTWIPLYILLVGLLIYRYRHCRWWVIASVLLLFGVAVGLSDYISSGIIKHLVCRLRPTHEPAIADLIHLVHDYRGGMYGFVSSHAANTMAVATLFTLLYRFPYRRPYRPIAQRSYSPSDGSPMGAIAQRSYSRRRSYSDSGLIALLYLWVAANCYSRMYLGVHYPGDIMGGLLVGGGVAVLVYLIWRRCLGAHAAGAVRE